MLVPERGIVVNVDIALLCGVILDPCIQRDDRWHGVQPVVPRIVNRRCYRTKHDADAVVCPACLVPIAGLNSAEKDSMFSF